MFWCGLVCRGAGPAAPVAAMEDRQWASMEDRVRVIGVVIHALQPPVLTFA